MWMGACRNCKWRSGNCVWDDVVLSKGNNEVLATAPIEDVAHEDRVVWLYDRSGPIDAEIAFFQRGIKPILVLGLLMVFVAFGQGWKAGLLDWKNWTWRAVFAASAIVFIVITDGGSTQPRTGLTSLAYSLI